MKTEPTYWVRLYLSGPIEVAKQIIREECLREGLCVTIEPTTFVYTGGEEAGYVVGLVNYPRFPAAPAQLEARGRDLMGKLLAGTFQQSALLMTPSDTTWITLRAANEALAHLDKVLNGCASHAEQQAADRAAREFLAGTPAA